MTGLTENHQRSDQQVRAQSGELNMQQSDLDHTITSLIEAQALKHSDRIAIVDGMTEIDYAQFLARADQIAAELITRGIQPGSFVGVCMSRSWQLIATLVGVLRAGCAYVPLDPMYPQERVLYMLKHSGAVAAIIEDDHAAQLCDQVNEQIRLDQVGDHAGVSITPPSPTDLAYVIYTSGSTGRPKGVAVEHRNLVSMSRAVSQVWGKEELTGVLAAASVCFDTSVMETLGVLSLGGTLILANNAIELPKLAHANRVKACVMVPSAMQSLLASHTLPESIRCVVFGGEALKLSLVKQIQALAWRPRVVNCYGPTEDTVFSTFSLIPEDAQQVTIGKSVPNSRAYILNDLMQPLPINTPGELYLAGDKLARGYLHDDEQTKARFVERQATAEIPETRLYRTGDLVQWNQQGEIEFLGRVDQQVKVRGYRVELGEIESTLELMPAVDAAAVAALESGAGQKMLVMYVVSRDPSLTDEAMKGFLAERLPKYMVPQLVMRLEALPLLPNDKLDRSKLPDMDAVRQAQVVSAAAVGDVALGSSVNTQPEAVLAIIQSEVAALLNYNDPAQIAAHLSFDSLGIDSLTTLELSSRLSKVLDLKLGADAVLGHGTPGSLAAQIVAMMGREQVAEESSQGSAADSLANFQMHIQSSHPTFQAAKANAWSATDKAKLVQEVMRMVNDNRRNPYSKVIRTGSASRGMVADAYNDESREAVIWTTNLYLGLNRDEQVIEAARNAVEQFGTGMGTSAAASGLTDLHLDFEREFAELVGKPSGCLFPTGYTANVGVIAGLLGKDDIVVIDQLCHASIVDGARLCGATIRTFQHNNAADLEKVLQSVVSPYRTVLVALEGVYSMGEGAAPVAEILRTAKQYGALTLVDEAHSFGFYGERGAGICAAQGVTEQADFIMTTLSKSLGSLGGIIAASKEHVDLLKSSARAYIFQASVSPADMAAALTALRRLRSDDSLRQRLWDTTRYMRAQFEAAGYDLGTGDGPIVTPHFADKDKLYAIVQGMYKRGVQTSAVTYPIVERGRGRLRLICSASHTREDVDKTLDALMEAEREFDTQADGRQRAVKDDALGIAEVEAWASRVSAYVRELVAEAAWPTPDLGILVALPEGETVSLVIQNGAVSIGTRELPSGLPGCTMQLEDGDAIEALCKSDIQLLLSSICNGGCELSGQVEPFIWLIGRLVDLQAKDRKLVMA